MTLSIHHVGTCLPCFVLDHCNGDDEALIGIPVDGSTTSVDLKNSVIADLWLQCDKLPERYDRAAIFAAADDCFASVRDPSKPFDSSLENPDTAEEVFGESVFAWFRVSWEA